MSVTRLRVRSLRFLPHFFWLSFRSMQQARRSPGHFASSLLRDADWTFWTLSVWESESSMRSFMLSGAHRRAMPRLLHWCDEASVAHWNQESRDLPSWQEAYRRLLSEGRPSKVNHPSQRHIDRTIPEPKTA